MPEQNLTDLFPGQEPLTVASAALGDESVRRYLSVCW